ncbi:Glutathione hydrolase 1 proenzyme [Bagarius yarrelli]|uniref:Glutathione hydrolase 1 proenzyme n=1 Tax=Bagarius yarrelli TaxID=175774 RepID=A0A556VUI2_BAGYA|nr:Glutathione hydrolase 1 proenzyme [Bagarius yarrelli]
MKNIKIKLSATPEPQLQLTQGNVRRSEGKVETINARETAPLKAQTLMYSQDAQLVKKGGLSIAVPGELRGYELAHRRHGRLPWRELFKPSIQLARDGILVSRALSKALTINQEIIQEDPKLCEVFCDANKEILKENDTIRFPQLADTLQRIAEEGADVFYKGSMAETIVKDIQDAGYNFSHNSVSTTEQKTLTYHRITEAFRFAYAIRSKLGDPHYINITELIHNMTSDYFAESLRKSITDNTTQPESYYGANYFDPESHGTAHLSIIAEDGSAVAVTSTINQYSSIRKWVILNSLFFNYDLKRAVEEPRIHNQLVPNYTEVEQDFEKAIIDGLTQKNHETKLVKSAQGAVVQAVVKQDQQVCAESDFRKGGRPAGY